MLLQTRLNDVSTTFSFLLANIKDALVKYQTINPELQDFYQNLKSFQFIPAEDKELDSTTAQRLAGFQTALKILTYSLYKSCPIRRQDVVYRSLEEIGTTIDAAQIENYESLRKLNKKIAFAELILGQNKLRSSPISVNIDPALSCNYRCKTCHHGAGIEEINKTILFPISSINKLEGLLKRVEAFHVFGGGEPTLGPSLVPMCEIIEKYKVNSSILTNGSTLGKIDAPLHVFNVLSISYDGDNARTFEAIRENSSFDKINDRIKAYKQEHPSSRIFLNVTVNKINLSEIEGIFRIGKDLGITAIVLNKMHEYYHQQKGMELSKKDIPEINRVLGRAKELSAQLDIELAVSISTELLREDNVELAREEMLQNLENHVTPPMQTAVVPIQEAVDQCRMALLSISTLYNRFKPTEEVVKPDFVCSYESLSEYLKILEEQIKNLNAEKVVLPFCFSPWLRMMIQPNAQVRPCCVLNSNMGSIEHEGGTEKVWNSEAYLKLRKGLTDGANSEENLPSSCKGCKFIERRVYGDELLEYARSLGVQIDPDQSLGFRE